MITTPFTIADNLPVTGASSQAQERYDIAVEAQLRLADDVAEAWEATVEDDPGFVLGQIGRAYLRCLSTEAPDAADARRILDDLGEPGGLNDRERRHLAAARAYAHRDLHGASERLASLSVAYPRDVLALAIGHQLDFFCGDSVTLRDRVGRALMSWRPAEPNFGFLLGMHAFGLEECGLYPQAEATGMRALAHDARDVWALHAVVHTHEMQGRTRDGLRTLEERRADWTEGNFLAVHNSWHEALLLLDAGHTERALGIYDTAVRHPESADVAFTLVDAAALLWRLHLDGADVGGRWSALAEAWHGLLDEPWYVFNDMHAAMSFVGAGRLEDARALVARLEAHVASGPRPSVSNVAMTAEVGLPVCSAILAFGEGRYGEVVDLLHPIRKIVYRFGGSHAQRDAVARTLFEAAIRAGDTDLAQALASERLAVKEANPYTWRQLARIRAATGDHVAATMATAPRSPIRSAVTPAMSASRA